MKNQKFCAHVRFFKGYDLFRIKSVYRFQVNILVIRWCYFYFRSGKSRILVSEVCKIPKSETETWSNTLFFSFITLYLSMHKVKLRAAINENPQLVRVSITTLRFTHVYFDLTFVYLQWDVILWCFGTMSNLHIWTWWTVYQQRRGLTQFPPLILTWSRRWSQKTYGVSSVKYLRRLVYISDAWCRL